MPNIITYQYFNKANELNIPLAAAQAVSSSVVAAPNSQSALTNTIKQVEKDILINALGVTIYNELQVALADLSNADQKWKDLVNGVEYDGKVWQGLSYDFSLLAYAVKYMFLNSNTQFYTAVGITQLNSENATTVSPSYILTNCWNNFTRQYQGDINEQPIIMSVNGNEFIDWFGSNNSVYVSLYNYLVDKKDDFAWTPEGFLLYERQNSFNI